MLSGCPRPNLRRLIVQNCSLYAFSRTALSLMPEAVLLRLWLKRPLHCCERLWWARRKMTAWKMTLGIAGQSFSAVNSLTLQQAETDLVGRRII